MPHICVSELCQHWFRQWLVAFSAPSHYLNLRWDIVNWTLRNKLQWNFNQNTKLFIHENASEIIVGETAAILSRGRWLTGALASAGRVLNGELDRFTLKLLSWIASISDSVSHIWIGWRHSKIFNSIMQVIRKLVSNPSFLWFSRPH